MVVGLNNRNILRDEKGDSSASGRNQRDGKMKDTYMEFNDADKEFKNDFGTVDLQAKEIKEILYLYPSDYPGMQLVSVPLTSMNFMNWSRSVRRALGAKRKLELLDGNLPEQDPSVSYYK